MTAIKIHYTETLIRSVVRRFWWRNIGWRFVGAFIFLLALFSYLVATGNRSWLVGVLGAVLVLAVAFAVALYVVHYRGSLSRFRRMRTPEATLELGEDRFKISADVGTTELAWSTITELWSFQEFILLFFSRAGFLTIPTADLDAQSREFIITKVRSHGAKVA